ncbi:MAG: leucine-rich repeat domain-containing protein [Prevotella sp.]
MTSKYQGCPALTEITLPEGLEDIGEYAFGYTGITQLVIPNSCTNFDVRGMKKVTTLTLPAGLKELPKNAFDGLTSLENITLPAGITVIPPRTFESCSNLKSVSIAEGVKTIGDEAFALSGIESIVIPESVEEIGVGAFYGCPNLESIDIKAPVKILPAQFAQGCPNLKSVSLPLGLEEIGYMAFRECSSLKQITLPSMVKGIQYAAFVKAGLESVSLPDGIERVGEFCFENTAVESVDLSNTSLTELCRGLFVSSVSLKSAILPASLKKLSEGNFDGCSALTSVTCNAQEPPVAEEYSFADAVKTSATLYVPDASLNAYKSADVWKDFFAVKGVSESGISSAVDTDADAVRDIYDLSGRKTAKASKGLNIFKMKSGETRKGIIRN